MRIPWRGFAIGSIFLIGFTYIAVVAANRINTVLPATQVCSLSVLFCLLLVLVFNPLLRWLRLRPMGRSEIILVFIMATVPASLSVYGYVGNVLPLIGSLHYKAWNTPQRQWNAKVTPFLDPGLFLGAPLFQERDVRNWQAFNAALRDAGQGNLPGGARRLWQLLPAHRQAQVVRAAQGQDYTEEEKAKALETQREKKRARLDVKTVELASWEVTLALQDLKARKRFELVRAIKRVLERRDFRTEADFQGVKLPPAGQRLLAMSWDKLSDEEVKQLNRLLLEASCPEHILPSRYVADQQPMRDYIRGLETRDKQAFPVFVKNPNETWGQFFKRLTHPGSAPFFGDINWGPWVGPLLRWGLIALVFLVLFYALNELVFQQWYKREQLAFPLAQLGETVLETDEAGSIIPPVFRNPFFALGFALAFSVLLYNATARAHWFGGLTPINLTGQLGPKVYGTALQGLRPFRMEIYFSVIGLAFLLPAEISFSVWFFFLLSKLQQLIAVWLGYGVDGWSFPADWYQRSNFMTAQGAGALQVFGLVYFWRVRHQVLAWLYRLARSQGNGQISREEIREYTMPSLLFFLGTVGVFVLMLHHGIPWGMAVLAYVALLFLTIAAVRLVAECGLIAFHLQVSPFHLMRIFGLLKLPVLFALKGLAPLMMFLQGFFLEQKTFVAATMLNGKYLAARSKLTRRDFIMSLVLGIGLVMIGSTLFTVILVHDRGIGDMRPWLFRMFPWLTFDSITRMMNNPEAMTQMNGTTAGWFSLGAALCGGLMYARRFLFWLPHPVGYVMFADGLSRFYWFSFFLAWVCKRAAIRYCDTEQYKTTRGFFIGMILGAVAAVGLATLIGLFYDPEVHTSFNPHIR